MSKKLRLAGLACAALTAACVVWAVVGDADARPLKYMLATLFAVGGLGMVLLGQCWGRIEALEARLSGANSTPVSSGATDDPPQPTAAYPVQVAPIALLAVMSMLTTVNMVMLASRPQVVRLPAPAPAPAPLVFMPQPLLQPKSPQMGQTTMVTQKPGEAPQPFFLDTASLRPGSGIIQNAAVLPESDSPALTQAVADRIQPGMSQDEVLAMLQDVAQGTPSAKTSLEHARRQGSNNIRYVLTINQGKRKLVLTFQDDKLADKNQEGLE